MSESGIISDEEELEDEIEMEIEDNEELKCLESSVIKRKEEIADIRFTILLTLKVELYFYSSFFARNIEFFIIWPKLGNNFNFSEQINLNEELVIELEATMANFESEMEHQRKMYESKLKLLEAKIKQAEEDRDNALKQTMKQSDADNPKVSGNFNF